MTETGIAAAFAFGALGSISHCLAMCGAFSLLMGRSRHPQHSLSLYHLGRVCTYTVLGVAGGTLGSLVNLAVPPLRIAHQSAVLISAAVMLFAGARLLLGRDLKLAGGRAGNLVQKLASRLPNGKTSASPFLLGLVLGLLPCGLIYSALSFSVLAADPLQGGITMAAFGAGTSPILFAAGALATHIRTNQPLLRRAAGGWLTACGVYFLIASFPG